MKNLSTAFKQALYNNERNYIVYADITLADSTELALSNSEIWSGGFSYEEAVSEDNNFTALGSAIIGSATLIINNIYETYTQYDFTNASVVLSLGMTFEENGSTRLEKFKVGTYTVDDTKYNGATISLSLLDNMELFDRPYNATYSTSPLIYPATLRSIVTDACEKCGVTLSTITFQNDTTQVTNRPTDATTFREVISWCATLAGCFAKCNANGELELKWFDQAKLEAFSSNTYDGGIFSPWEETDTLDGGTFNPWSSDISVDGGTFNNFDTLHHIYPLSSQNLGLDDVVVTGLSVTLKNTDSSAAADTTQYSVGSSGYVIELNENPFLTNSNAQTIINRLGNQLIGLRFRPVNVQHLNDPSIEAGDVAVVIDRKQNVYPIVVTRTSFSVDGYQTTVCGASTPSRNSATRFTEQTKSWVEARELVVKERTARQQAIDALNRAIASSSGLYYTAETTQSGSIYYLHDLPQLSQSSVVMKVTSEAVAMTDAYNGAHPDQTVWNFGVTVNGTVIANYLSANGINAGWINAGQLVVRDQNNNETFFVDTATGVVRIAAAAFSLTGGSVTSSWSGDGVPTNNNYPASNWSGTREQHLGDVYYDNAGSGIYKYSMVMQGYLLTFNGTYEFTGTGEAFVISFLYDDQWYRYVNPFTNGTVRDVSIFIPTEFVVGSGLNRNYAFCLWTAAGSAGLTYNLTYEATKVYDVFPGDAEIYGTEPAYSGVSSRNLSTEYTLTKTSETAIYNQAIHFNTTLATIPVPGWKNIGVSGEDEYARALAENASATANTASSNASSALSTANSTQSALNTLDAGLYGQNVLNRLSNNGAIQGMWIENGRLYISFTSARGGTLTLGGANNTNGILVMQDANGYTIGQFDKDGVLIQQSPINYNVGDTIEIGDGIRFTGNYSGSGAYFGPAELDTGDDTPWDGYDTVFAIYGYGSNQFSHPLVICDKTYSAGIQFRTGNGVEEFGDLTVDGNFVVLPGHTKNRAVRSPEYGVILLHSYETPTPYFGDIGTGQTDENGEAVVSIDDIFDETVNTAVEYAVFLQKEGPGDIWVAEKERNYFVVKGTANLKFSWEVKAVQKGFETLRLDDMALSEENYNVADLTDDFKQELKDYDKEMEELYQ